MAMEFCDGFDLGQDLTAKWGSAPGGYGSISINASGGRDGRGALQCNKAWVVWNGASEACRTVGMAFKWDLASNSRCIVFQDSGTDVGVLANNSNGTFSVIRGSDETVLATSTAAVTAGVWCYIEFKYTPSTSCGANDVIVRLNQTEIIHLSAGTVTGVSAHLTCNRLLIGSVSGALNSFSCTIDDVVILDSSESFWGDVVVEGRTPTGSGNYSNFAAAGGSPNFECVDEIPNDGDTTYVTSSSLNARDSYTFPAPFQAVQEVKAIQTSITARKVGAAAIGLAPMFRQGGTDYDEPSTDLTTSYAIYLQQLRNNPATGVEWTVAEIDAGVEAGQRVTT